MCIPCAAVCGGSAAPVVSVTLPVCASVCCSPGHLGTSPPSPATGRVVRIGTCQGAVGHDRVQ